MNGNRDIAVRVAVAKYIGDVANATVKSAKKTLEGSMSNGDRVKAVTDDGSVVGLVWRTDPKGTAVVTDRPALTAWVVENYPERIDTEYVPIPWHLVVKVLEEHAPELLTGSQVIAPWAEGEILRNTVKAKHPCGPGGEADVPGVAYEPPAPGVVTAKLSDDAAGVIGELWRSGRISPIVDDLLALSPGNEN